jgi:hypothetical protein
MHALVQCAYGGWLFFGVPVLKLREEQAARKEETVALGIGVACLQRDYAVYFLDLAVTWSEQWELVPCCALLKDQVVSVPEVGLAAVLMEADHDLDESPQIFLKSRKQLSGLS